MNQSEKLISEKTRATVALRLFALAKIPMMFYARLWVAEISAEQIVVRIPLRRRTKNHLGSMYFGALSVGAHCAAGALAMQLIKHRPERICLELFSKLSEQVHHAAEQHKALKILEISFVANHETTEVMQPRKQALHLPAPDVASQRCSVLGGRSTPVGAMGRNQFNASCFRQSFVQRVTVVDTVTDELLRRGIHLQRIERWLDQGYFMRRSTRNPGGDR